MQAAGVLKDLTGRLTVAGRHAMYVLLLGQCPYDGVVHLLLLWIKVIQL